MASQLISNANTRADSLITDANTFIDELKDLTTEESIRLDYNVYSTDGSRSWTITPWDLSLRVDTEIEEIPGYEKREVSISNELNSFIAEHAEDGVEIPDIPELPEGETSYYQHNLPEIWVDPENLPEFDDEPIEISEISLPEVATPDVPVDSEVTSPIIAEWVSKTVPDNNVEIFEPNVGLADAQEIDNVDLTVPELTLIPPVNPFAHEEQTYSSGLLASMQALLSADIEDGGYGINVEDEQNIYNRARTREAIEVATSVNQARKGIAARGFPVPPGSLYAIERVILAKGQSALSELNKEIVINRSDLYLKARQFAVQQGLNLEQALITYTSGKQERALKAAQIAADFVIQFHNASVQLFQLKMEVKQLELAAHNQQLATAATRLQEYGQKLAYADMTIKRNQVRLQDYNHDLDAVKTFYAAQTATDEHTKLSIQIEQLKLQANQNKIATYAATIKARADEYDTYSAQWQAEEIKQRVFTQQLEAHDKQVETVIKTSKLKQDHFKDELELLEAARMKQATILEHFDAQLRDATFVERRRSTMYQEDLDVWKFKQADKDRYNEFAYRRNVEKVTKILEATRTNIQQMNAAFAGFTASKELNKAAAESALRLYSEAVAKAEDSFLAIGTVADATA